MTTSQAEYEWATRCVDCGGALRMHDREDDARASFDRDARYEARERDTHRIQLIRRAVPEWEVVAELPSPSAITDNEPASPLPDDAKGQEPA